MVYQKKKRFYYILSRRFRKGDESLLNIPTFLIYKTSILQTFRKTNALLKQYRFRDKDLQSRIKEQVNFRRRSKRGRGKAVLGYGKEEFHGFLPNLEERPQFL